LSGTGRAFVVIPCLNEQARIAALLDELLCDDAWTDPLIIVADGGSSDGTREIVEARAARDPRVRLVHNAARIQSAGVNGAARSAGKGRRWMVRIDAHARYSKDYVSSLVREAEETGAASVVVAMRSAGNGCFQRATAAAQNSRLGTGGSAHRTGGEPGFVEHGHHALFDLAQFHALGGYDETFTHNEDAEFDARLARAGGRIWLTRRASMVYQPRGDALALFRQYLAYGGGRARMLLKHHQRPRPRQLIPLLAPPALLLAVAVPWWPLAAAPAAAWLGLCLAWGVVLGARTGSACAAAAGAPAALMHLGFALGFYGAVARSLRARPAPPPGASVSVQ
jgi:succinoglycan biosynthesis protein ExoA